MFTGGTSLPCLRFTSTSWGSGQGAGHDAAQGADKTTVPEKDAEMTATSEDVILGKYEGGSNEKALKEESVEKPDNNKA